MESVETLERIANRAEPPMGLAEIEGIRTEFKRGNANETALKMRLEGMQTAFRGRGDLSRWNPDVLRKIDECFVTHYMDDQREPCACLFSPDDPENLNKFNLYIDGVDGILRAHAGDIPHARAYLAYFSIWKMQDYRFPVPLGTASVVEALDKILQKVTLGFSEVSTERLFCAYCTARQCAHTTYTPCGRAFVRIRSPRPVLTLPFQGGVVVRDPRLLVVHARVEEFSRRTRPVRHHGVDGRKGPPHQQEEGFTPNGTSSSRFCPRPHSC